VIQSVLQGVELVGDDFHPCKLSPIPPSEVVYSSATLFDSDW